MSEFTQGLLLGIAIGSAPFLLLILITLVRAAPLRRHRVEISSHTVDRYFKAKEKDR